MSDPAKISLLSGVSHPSYSAAGTITLTPGELEAMISRVTAAAISAAAAGGAGAPPITGVSKAATSPWITLPSGERYQGEMDGGVPNGEGTMIITTGIRVSGTWVYGDLTGYGEMSFPDGKTYKGMFLKGCFEGDGCLSSPTGWTYTGKFEKGKKQGAGTLVGPRGERKTGIFKDGELWRGEHHKGNRAMHYEEGSMNCCDACENSFY